ncbi:MAG: beta-lactamase family protein [Acidobacteria bacterium]|nr:beta-lactamase family protein [Acidobacteriota bacterium]
MAEGTVKALGGEPLRLAGGVTAEAVGVQRPDGKALHLDHMWPIASAGKPLTAAVVMSLVEEGLIGIAQPVIDYLPELRETGNDEVLVHHLLTHTAGWESALRTHRLENLIEAGDFPAAPPGRNLVEHVFLSLAFDPVKVSEPGEQMDYDNSHYTLLAEIVRRVTGGTLDAAMRARVIDPLGMSDSAVIVGEALQPKLVKRAEGLPFGPDAMASFEGEAWESADSGAGGVHTSPCDLLTFGQMILNGGVGNGERVLSPGSVRSMATNQIPGVPAIFLANLIPEGSWGYGFTVVTEWPYPYFAGGLVPLGSVMHPGAGGVVYWIDFRHEIVGVFFEVITEVSEFMEPVSGIGHRLQDVITGAVVE